MKVLLALPEKQPKDFEAWLFTIAKYTLYDYYRKHKMAYLPEDFDRYLKSEDKSDQFGKYDDHIERLNKLSEKLRKPILLYGRGYHYDEIAEILQLNVSTVKSRIFQAREKLKWRNGNESSGI